MPFTQSVARRCGDKKKKERLETREAAVARREQMIGSGLHPRGSLGAYYCRPDQGGCGFHHVGHRAPDANEGRKGRRSTDRGRRR
jgi:hypothetical protein